MTPNGEPEDERPQGGTDDGSDGGSDVSAAGSPSGTPDGGGEAVPSLVEVPEGVESSLPGDVPRIHLSVFEGPLDLLLYLIRRERIDIHDIPIAPITRQYMEYLDLMKELNLEVAGDFLVMAATLIHIKSKMLVPVEPTEVSGDEEQEDPREELVRRLLEFQRYKEAAGILHQQAQIRAATWIRPDAAIPRFAPVEDDMLEAGLFDLIAAFRDLLERRKALVAHEVEGEGKTVEERMAEVLVQVREGESVDFVDLFEADATKAALILTFLALLELIRMKRIRVFQKGHFGAIRIFRPVGPTEGTAPVLLGEGDASRTPEE